jgi:hypothetical protein
VDGTAQAENLSIEVHGLLDVLSGDRREVDPGDDGFGHAAYPSTLRTAGE